MISFADMVAQKNGAKGAVLLYITLSVKSVSWTLDCFAEACKDEDGGKASLSRRLREWNEAIQRLVFEPTD